MAAGVSKLKESAERRTRCSQLPRHRTHAVLWLLPLLEVLLAPAAHAEVLLAQMPGGEVRECEAVNANWNQAIEDAGKVAFAGEIYFEEKNPHGCEPFDARSAQSRLVLIDTSAICDHLVATAGRAAIGGALGVIFFHHEEDGLVGIALGDRTAPPIRAVMIERQHGEAIHAGLSEGMVKAELVQGRLISDDAYEEQFIFRQDEITSTRAVNFLCHVYPEMLPSLGRTPLSLQVMRSNVEVPSGWFSRTPSFVPIFNPSILARNDGTLLATLRMSNGPGCPSVRRLRESSMDTRRFKNELVLVHLDAQTLNVLGHVLVKTPPLICRFDKQTKASGRQFLDEVQGPMDARIVSSDTGQPWVSFYAERNVLDSDEIVRGIHAAPLHIQWRECSAGEDTEWQLRREDGVFAGTGCQWLGVGDGSSLDRCRASCDVAAAAGSSACNSISFRVGHCQLRWCSAESSTTTLKGWQAWTKSATSRWHRRQQGCAFLAIGSGTNVQECQRSCEAASRCDAILFAEDRSPSCLLQRCSVPSAGATAVVPQRLVPRGWQAWRRGAGPPRDCLDHAWIEASELIAFPVGSGVEKNWNFIRIKENRLMIEYHVDPHIVLEAHIHHGPTQNLEVYYMSTSSVSRWPFDVLHGVSNVRGGFCCLELPEKLWRGRLHGGNIPDGDVAGAGATDAAPPPTGSLLLGCGHLQRIRTPFDQAPGDVGRFRRQAKSRTYHQFFYALRAEEPFDVVAVSSEWCASANGHFSEPWRAQLSEGEEACEAIQFAAGLALRGDDELIVGYGINDCEADLLVLPLARVLAMLRPVRSQVNASLDDIEMI